MTPGVLANPEEAHVVYGDVTFQQLLNTLNINAATRQAIIEWLRFSIANGETVNFNLPDSSSFVLNRVTGFDPSVILGNLFSNGQIFLINPNGVLFGSSSRVDTAGLVASTLDISNDDFLAGRFNFVGSGGSVINQGIINAPGGYVALLGSSVENSGIITSNLGTVALASGQRITLDLDPQGLMSVVIEEAVSQNQTGAQNAVNNTGTISANGGKVILTAKSLNGVFDRAINNEGIIEAQNLQSRNGQVYLSASGEGAVVRNAGTITSDLTQITAPNVEFDGGLVNSTGLTVNAANNITLRNGAFLFGNVVNLNSGQDIAINSDSLVRAYRLNLRADRDFTMSGSSRIVASNMNDLRVGRNMTLNDASEIHSDWLSQLTVINDLTLNHNSSIYSNYINGISVGHDLVLNHHADIGGYGGILQVGHDLIMRDDSTLSSVVNEINVDNDLVMSGNAQISGLAEFLYVDHGIFMNDRSRISSPNSIFMDVGSLTMNDESNIFAGSDLRIYSGNLTMNGASSIESGNYADFNIDRDLTLSDDAQIEARTLYLGAGNDLSLNGSSRISSYSIEDLTVGRNLTLNDQSEIHSSWLSQVHVLNDLLMNGSSAFNLAYYNVNVGRDVIMNDLARISGNGGLLQVGNDLTMNDSAAILTTVNELDVNRNLTMNGASRISGLAAFLNVGNNMTLFDNSNISASNIMMEIGNSLALNDHSSITADDLRINAGNLEMNDISSIASGNYAELNILNDFSMAGQSQLEARTAYLNVGHDLSLRGNSHMNVEADLHMSAGHNVALRDQSQIDAGTIGITAGNSLYIDSPIEALGDIVLEALEDIYVAGGIFPIIRSLNGSIIMNAMRDVVLGYTAGLGMIHAATTGNIIVNALRDIIVKNEMFVTSNRGRVEMTAGHNINLLDLAYVGSYFADVVLNAANSIIQESAALIEAGRNVYLHADTDADGQGGIQMQGSAAIISNGGYIELTTGTAPFVGGGDIWLGLLDAGSGSVFIRSGSGAIRDNNGSRNNVVAHDLNLWARNGIGSDNALETQVFNLQGYNAAIGNINIENSGELHISGDGVVNRAAGGGIDILTASPLYVDSLIEANGDISLRALGADGDILIAGGRFPIIRSLDGSIYMKSMRDIVFGYSGGLGMVHAARNGSIIARALRDILIQNEMFVTANRGNILFNAGRDISLLDLAYLASYFGDVTLIAGRSFYRGPNAVIEAGGIIQIYSLSTSNRMPGGGKLKFRKNNPPKKLILSSVSR
ncbi:MAG: filamentous hemagglutinin N-terminal domain-containing protein [Candidatus Omnitrophota bacterium]|nr:filamentous hemagglutinin N-terminal domain-containing protein [Candidatus Omnitrophota bacterium]